jgi:hypothetical protein
MRGVDTLSSISLPPISDLPHVLECRSDKNIKTPKLQKHAGAGLQHLTGDEAASGRVSADRRDGGLVW